MSLVLKKPAFCICENKDADQLRGNRETDQRLCFRYTDSTIPLLPKSEISSLQPSSLTVQPGLCRTWSENPEDRFSHNEAHIMTVSRKKLLQQGISNPEFYGDLVYKFKIIIGNPNFSDIFKQIVNRFKT